MRGTKSLQDLFVDCRVPRERRDRVPLLISPKGIAWVVGVRIAEWARVKPGELRGAGDALRAAT